MEARAITPSTLEVKAAFLNTVKDRAKARDMEISMDNKVDTTRHMVMFTSIK